jgi:hypothetical protein
MAMSEMTGVLAAVSLCLALAAYVFAKAFFELVNDTLLEARYTDYGVPR